MKKSLSSALSIFGAVLAVSLAGCGGSTVVNVSIGGTVSGLTVSGLVLSDGLTSLAVDANATSFKFPTRLNEGVSYVVGVLTQPALMTCTVANAIGVVGSSDVTNVVVTCTPNNKLGGVVKNLRGTGLVLTNGSDTVQLAPAASLGADVSFEFTKRVAIGANYGVTVLTQPSAQSCAVANGSGTMGTVDKADVEVTCQ